MICRFFSSGNCRSTDCLDDDKVSLAGTQPDVEQTSAPKVSIYAKAFSRFDLGAVGFGKPSHMVISLLSINYQLNGIAVLHRLQFKGGGKEFSVVVVLRVGEDQVGGGRIRRCGRGT